MRSRRYAPHQSGGYFSPFDLGSSLLAWYDAERPDTLTLSGSLVTSWRDIITGFILTAAGSSRPAYTTSAFNSRPGIVFDGTDDILSATTYPSSWPSTASPSWLWGLASQENVPGTPARGDVFQYGSAATTANTRRLSRNVSGGVNRADALNGPSSAINTSVDYTNRHVAICKVTATTVECVIDGVGMTPVAGVPNTTASEKAAIGGAVNGGDFFLGRISSVLLTGALTAAQESALTSFLQQRV